eukprot:1145829-Pelagomonas_calceolata.AAC.2
MEVRARLEWRRGWLHDSPRKPILQSYDRQQKVRKRSLHGRRGWLSDSSQAAVVVHSTHMQPLRMDLRTMNPSLQQQGRHEGETRCSTAAIMATVESCRSMHRAAHRPTLKAPIGVLHAMGCKRNSPVRAEHVVSGYNRLQ